MKKQIIIAIVIAAILSVYAPMVNSATTVQGTFTPTGASLSIDCNKTAPGFGDINLGASAENLSFNLTNEGTVNASVTMTAGQGTGGWTLVAGTSSPATSNEYCVNMDGPEAGYVDVYSQQTVVADLVPAGAGTNYTSFDMKVFVSEFTIEETPSQQSFYANLTAAEVS